MTDEEARIDAQVRRALTTLPFPDEADTRAALVTVLTRADRARRGAGTRRRTSRRWLAPAVAAASVAVVAGTVALGAVNWRDPDQQPPQQTPGSAVGTWQRDLPGSAPPQWQGTWEMTLRPDGVLALSGPADAPESDGASYAADSGTLRVDAFVNNVCAELPAGVYQWTVDPAGLTLTMVDEPCPARADLLEGTWEPGS